MTLLLPNTEIVGRGWLALALPDVGNDERLPAADAAMRTVGFIRTVTSGGNLDPSLPRWRQPVITAECWVAPQVGVDVPPWNRALQLAERVIAATDDRTLMGRTLDLTGFGGYAAANVRTVSALNEPRRTPDPSKYARYDVDLQFSWTGV